MDSQAIRHCSCYVFHFMCNTLFALFSVNPGDIPIVVFRKFSLF